MAELALNAAQTSLAELAVCDESKAQTSFGSRGEDLCQGHRSTSRGGDLSADAWREGFGRYLILRAQGLASL